MNIEGWDWVNCKVFAKEKEYKTGGVNGTRRRGMIENLEWNRQRYPEGSFPGVPCKQFGRIRTLNSLCNVLALCDILAGFAVNVQEGIVDPLLIQQQVYNINPPF